MAESASEIGAFWFSEMRAERRPAGQPGAAVPTQAIWF
jgi:hypothetical protein